MKDRKLIEVLRAHGIAKVRSASDSGGNIVYVLEGRLPEFPFRSRLISYTLVVNAEDHFVKPEEIDALLHHFWQGQVDLPDLN